ncbi:hypothetical protein V6N11_031586 [Hibiscus sabdariffa]|uniref:Uncharacterized protein n=1 Tax=Hibiscus sabdariffa TaxID=183260 RepID=A0ABR2SYM9_9ROSI
MPEPIGGSIEEQTESLTIDDGVSAQALSSHNTAATSSEFHSPPLHVPSCESVVTVPIGGHTEAESDTCNVTATSEYDNGVPIDSEVLVPASGHTEAESDTCNVAATSEHDNGVSIDSEVLVPTGGHTEVESDTCNVAAASEHDNGVPIDSEVLAGADLLPGQTSSAVDVNQDVEVVVEATSDQEIYGKEAHLGVSSDLAMEVNEESHRLEAPDVTTGQVIQPAAVVQFDGAEAILSTGAGSRNTHIMFEEFRYQLNVRSRLELEEAGEM